VFVSAETHESNVQDRLLVNNVCVSPHAYIVL
jgi:hypothetical protein